MNIIFYVICFNLEKININFLNLINNFKCFIIVDVNYNDIKINNEIEIIKISDINSIDLIYINKNTIISDKIFNYFKRILNIKFDYILILDNKGKYNNRLSDPNINFILDNIEKKLLTNVNNKYNLNLERKMINCCRISKLLFKI